MGLNYSLDRSPRPSVFGNPEIGEDITILNETNISSGMPAANAFNGVHEGRMRVDVGTGDGVVDIEIADGKGYLWDLVVLAHHTMSSAGTWRVQAATSEAGLSTPAVDSGVLPYRPGVDSRPLATSHGGWLVPSVAIGGTGPHAYRFVRFTISDSANPIGWVDVRQIVVARAVAVAAQPGSDVPTLSDPSSVSRSGGGVPHVHDVARFREASISVKGKLRSEVASVWRAWEARGIRKPVVVWQAPDDLDYSHLSLMYGRFSKKPSLRFDGGDNTSYQFTLTEP